MDYMPYTPEADQQNATGTARRNGFVIKFVTLIILLLITTGTTYWVASKYPDKVSDLIISIDRFGITDVGALEQKRIRTINRLAVTYEEKQVLIQRTVFLNATREMVYLALGDPMCVLQTPATKSEPAIESWVYYIEGERKPTKLAFQNNELTSAGKASALDTCK
ncbi:MAG: hypothetical protein MK052_11025 [Alphaproteobacteria bacterium]|nr:hypothetical protein [Alphaproteobacteria bacterium]